MTNQYAVFESHVHLRKPQYKVPLCKPRYKSTGFDEFLMQTSTRLISIHLTIDTDLYYFLHGNSPPICMRVYNGSPSANN